MKLSEPQFYKDLSRKKTIFLRSGLGSSSLNWNWHEIYNVYEIKLWAYKQNNFTLERAVTLTKNVDFDTYRNSRYDIGFDVRRRFLLFDGGELSKNEILFGADMCILIIEKRCPNSW